MNKLHRIGRVIVIVFSLVILTLCTRLQYVFFEKSLRDEYTRNFTGKQIYDESLEKRWIASWKKVDFSPLTIDLPYSEKGIYNTKNVEASSFELDVKQGEKLVISVKSKQNFFIEIYEKYDKKTLLKSYDNTSNENDINLQVKNDAKYLIKFQPTLMSFGNYSLNIYRKPRMIFPVVDANNSSVKSFFGNPRDGGIRKHKGIDIFAEKGTPVVSTMNGVAFTENGANGGKTIWVHNIMQGLSTYYAHLDSQLVQGGKVEIGDTIGIVGNTGNAKFTLPHLHFGIYKRGIGPVDPFPFVKEASITTNLKVPSFMEKTRYVRVKNISDLNLEKAIIKDGDVYKVMAITDDKVRVRLPYEHRDLLIPLENIESIKIENEG